MEKIKIMYHSKEIDKVGAAHEGEWVDLSNAKEINMKAGDFAIIPLGISMELPKGYEAIVAPRSSIFKKYGLIQTNGIGVIDYLYKGDKDEWGWAVYATRDVMVPVNTRVCQFRIQKQQPLLDFVEVDSLENSSRGGFGSTDVAPADKFVREVFPNLKKIKKDESDRPARSASSEF